MLSSSRCVSGSAILDDAAGPHMSTTENAPAVATAVVIRELDRDDLDQLLSLYRHLHEQDNTLPDRAKLEQIWAGILDDSAQIYVGACVEEALVAACNACIVPNLTRGARPYAVIENVVTHTDYRRQGIGASVLRDLLARCWARGCYKVMLMSAVKRAEIHAFYEALGFDKKSKQAFVIRAG